MIQIRCGTDMLIRKFFKIQDTIQLGYFNKKKPRPNRHRKTIRHNKEIAFTQQSFSNKQRDKKQTATTIEI